MTQAPEHVIGSQVLEITMEERAEARATQARLSELAARRLPFETERIFSELAPAGCSCRIERLEVDLGALRAGWTDEEYLERFRRALREALVEVLLRSGGGVGPSPAAVSQRPGSDATGLLAHLLEYGAMPWWAGTRAARSLEELLLEVARSQPAGAREMLMRLGRRETVRQRLVRQLSPAALKLVVELLAPAEAAFIFGYAEEVARQQKETGEPPAPAEEFREVVWELILAAVIEHRGSHFNEKAFLRWQLSGLAQRFGIEYGACLEQLATPAREVRAPGKPSSIWRLVRELQAEHRHGEARAGVHAEGGGEGGSLGERLEQWFRAGAAAATSDGTGVLRQSWWRQSNAWQALFWERAKLWAPASVIAARALQLFPGNEWLALQRTLPGALDTGALGALVGAAPGWPGFPEEHRRSFWERAFVLGLARGGAHRLHDARTLERLLEGMPIGGDELALDRLLRTPAIRRHARVRSALAQLVRRPVASESPLNATEIAANPGRALALLARWSRGEGGPMRAALCDLPGGVEALLLRLELHHREAFGAFLRKLLANGNDRARFLGQAGPALRRRVLAVLAPAAAPVLESYLATVAKYGDILAGTGVSARDFAESAWQAVLQSVAARGAEAAAVVFTRAVRAHWQVVTRAAGFQPEALGARVCELARRLPSSIAGRRLAGWLERAVSPGGERPSTSSPAIEPLNLQDLPGRLELWRSLLDAASSRAAESPELAGFLKRATRDAPYLYRELLEQAAPDLAVVERLLAQGGESFLLRVGTGRREPWCAEFREWMELIEKLSAQVPLLPLPRGAWRARALHELLRLLRGSDAGTAEPGFVMLEILCRLGVPARLPEKWDEVMAAVPGAPPLATWTALPPAQGLSLFLLAWTHSAPGKASTRARRFLQRISRAVERAALVRQSAPTHPKMKTPSPAPRKPAETNEPLFVENGGLVILAPFFARYHEANGLLHDGLFRDPAAAERAAHLLQALLSEAEPALEQRLVLNKVLCGLPPPQPIRRHVEYTPRELDHAMLLLRSAIANWPQVSTISIEGFRNSFLWRRGKLARGAERWTLTLEQRGYDVLFSSLPWSFSIIKPAWMPEPLYVEWV